MIVLIVGDFGVGKDTVADMIIKESLRYNDCEKFQKILSYCTREPRYEGENTHIFVTKEEFLQYNDFIAYTVIDGKYYGARKSQFDPSKVNLYCVDGKGVNDVLHSHIHDDIFVVEVIRPKWLIDFPKERLSRNRHFDHNSYKSDYRIINDGDLVKLESSVKACFDFLMKEVKKSL